MLQCHWFLDRALLGVGFAPDLADSQAFYCEQCGDIWARCVVTGSARCLLVHRPCIKHTPISAVDWGSVPGTLASWRNAANSPYWDTAHCVEHLPRGVLKREYEILLTHYLARSTSHDDQQEANPACPPEQTARP